FGRGRRKARIKNLKSAAEVYAYLQDKGISSPADIERRIAALKASPACKRIDELEHRINLISRQIREAETVIRLTPVFEGLKKEHFKSSREKYRADHAKELRQFHAASKTLEKIGGLADEAFLAERNAELASAKAELAELWESSGELFREMDMLRSIKRAVERSAEAEGKGNEGRGR
ncbi:MAG: hypothetical protein K6G83_08850, partial [Lachnospiraceae bacterium]|nr:hypothetical protein [Lachnospiraceae bacterium]